MWHLFRFRANLLIVIARRGHSKYRWSLLLRVLRFASRRRLKHLRQRYPLYIAP